MNVHEIVGILMFITAISSYINYRYVNLPKSIGITLLTLFFTLIIATSGHFGLNIEDFANNFLGGIGFNETFLHGMLSFLLFAGSLHVNAMELSRHKALVALLATVSVIISTILVGYATYLLVKFLGIDLPFYYCFVFGALISPTDPIAVLGILKTLKVSKTIELKIAGEALFNDGMGIVLFFIALAIASGSQEAVSPQTILFYFLRQGFGGFIVGAIIGYLAAKLLKTIDDYEVAIIITLSIVTGGYTLAHSVLYISGPICMAVAGLFIGNYMKNGNMTKFTKDRLYAFWELLDEVLNAILFVLIGLEFIGINFNLYTTIASFGVILITLVCRWISIFIPVISLSRFKKFSTSIVLVMTWGGLRGGISIALALSIDGQFHDFIVAITYAVVLFSMMIQGLTISPLFKKITSITNRNLLFNRICSSKIRNKNLFFN